MEAKIDSILSIVQALKENKELLLTKNDEIIKRIATLEQSKTTTKKKSTRTTKSNKTTKSTVTFPSTARYYWKREVANAGIKAHEEGKGSNGVETAMVNVVASLVIGIPLTDTRYEDELAKAKEIAKNLLIEVLDDSKNSKQDPIPKIKTDSNNLFSKYQTKFGPKGDWFNSVSTARKAAKVVFENQSTTLTVEGTTPPGKSTVKST